MISAKFRVSIGALRCVDFCWWRWCVGRCPARRRPICRPADSSRRLHRWPDSSARVNWQGFYVGGQAVVRLAERRRSPGAISDLQATFITPRRRCSLRIRHAAEYGEQLARRLWRLCRIQLRNGTMSSSASKANYMHDGFRRRDRLRSGWSALPPTTVSRARPTRASTMKLSDFGSLRVARRLRDGMFPALRLRRRSASAMPDRRSRRFGVSGPASLPRDRAADSKSKLIYGYTAGARRRRDAGRRACSCAPNTNTAA